MAGILDILRAAAMPVAAARSGHLQGERVRTDRERAEAERQRSIAEAERQRLRQIELDKRAEEDRQRGIKRQGELDARDKARAEREGLIDQARRALLEAQAGETSARAQTNRARAGYYSRTAPRGSGPNGELTPRDKQRFIGQRLERRMTPEFDEFGRLIPGTGMSREEALAEAEKDWLASTGGAGATGDQTSASGPRTRFGTPRPIGAPQSTPPAAKADTQTKTGGPLRQGAPRTAIDTTALFKKYNLEP